MMSKNKEFWDAIRPTNWFTGGIDYEFDLLSEYIDMMETVIEDKQYELQTKVERQVPLLNHEGNIDITEDEIETIRDELWQQHSEEGWRIFAYYPNILRLSFFTSCYFIFEDFLLRLCNNLHQKNKYNLKVKELNGKGRVQAHTYLKKVVGVDFPDGIDEWGRIMKYNLLRNVIVHRNGIPNDEQINELCNFFDKNKYLSFAEVNNRIEMKREFLLEVLSTYRAFFDSLINEIIRIDPDWEFYTEDDR